MPSSATPTEPVLNPWACAPIDVPVDSAEPALVDRPEAVDEKVVTDVVPPVPLDVEQLDPLHDGRGLGTRVAVPAGRVVDDGESEVGRVRGRPRRIDSSAPHVARGTIVGVTVAAGVRHGISVAGLHTRWARTRETLPRARTWMPSDSPAHHAFPMRQPLALRSASRESGPSSASGAPARHGLQRPVVERVRGARPFPTRASERRRG